MTEKDAEIARLREERDESLCAWEAEAAENAALRTRAERAEAALREIRDNDSLVHGYEAEDIARAALAQPEPFWCATCVNGRVCGCTVEQRTTYDRYGIVDTWVREPCRCMANCENPVPCPTCGGGA